MNPLVTNPPRNLLFKENRTLSEERGKFPSSMNSYLGIMKHYKTYTPRKEMIFGLLSCWSWKYIYLKGGIGKFSLKKKFKLTTSWIFYICAYRRIPEAKTRIYHIKLFKILRLSDLAVKSSFRSGLDC